MSSRSSKKQRAPSSSSVADGLTTSEYPDTSPGNGLFSSDPQRNLDAPALGPILHQVIPGGALSGAPSISEPCLRADAASGSPLSTALQQYSMTNPPAPQDSSAGLQTFPLQGPLIPVPVGQRYVDITDYLNMPQTKAAEKLGLPTSTLSKRWKEAVCNRKWPFRAVQKLDKEITTLLYNVPTGDSAPPLPKEIEDALARLLRKREEELRSVVVRI